MPRAIAELSAFLDAYHQLSKKSAEQKRASYGQLLHELAPRYEQILAMRRGTAQRFNVFSALGVSRKELVHSGFLAFLLDPLARHDQGDRLLRSFLRRLSIEVPVNVNLARSSVVREYTLGQYGRLDIAVFLPNGGIVGIENKVDAPDREGQVFGYQQALGLLCRGAVGCHALLFLTPDGRQPRSCSAEVDVTCWSYGDLASWLGEHDALPERLQTVMRMYTETCLCIGEGE